MLVYICNVNQTNHRSIIDTSRRRRIFLLVIIGCSFHKKKNKRGPKKIEMQLQSSDFLFSNCELLCTIDHWGGIVGLNEMMF